MSAFSKPVEPPQGNDMPYDEWMAYAIRSMPYGMLMGISVHIVHHSALLVKENDIANALWKWANEMEKQHDRPDTAVR